MAEVQLPQQNPNQTQPVTRQKLKPIANGKIHKTLGQKFKETFISDDVKNVKGYVKDAAVSAFKNTLADVLINTINMTLGTNIRRPVNNGTIIRNGLGTVVQTTYSGYFNAGKQQQNVRPAFQKSTSVPTDWNSIVIVPCEGETDADCKRKAEDVINRLCDIIEVYNQTSLLDLYELVGIPTSASDYNYGWTELTRASVQRVSDGYWLKLPTPQPLSK